MYNDKFYIHGQWVDCSRSDTLEVINPATEQSIMSLRLGQGEDVDSAVAAAKEAFQSYSQWSKEQRLQLLERILEEYNRRADDMARAITSEMGAPSTFSEKAQVGAGAGHLHASIKALKNLEESHSLKKTEIYHEPVGVCALITPWNWPINQIMCKVAPALAAGCTMVLKPSEEAPLSAIIMTEILETAGVPAGVFNMVHGTGLDVGAPLSSHPDVDLVSFTGSTQAGVAVMKAAAETIKKVCLELGGKSANILLDDVDFERSVKQGVLSCFSNTGQSCNAPTRMLVPESKMDEVIAIAEKVSHKANPGDPLSEDTTMGPVVSQRQYERIQKLIQSGIDEGATLVCGGTGKPEGNEIGYFVKPTIFAHANNQMTIAQEEIFGPVLTIIPYKDEAEAIAIANDSQYGLSGYVSSADLERAKSVARRLRTGMVHLNGAPGDINAPFGGYKQSGNGREWGAEGLKEFMEIKAVMGHNL
jgi:aldehyde dehydrogenase (NAD+)